MWGPKEALILTVIETLAPTTTPDDADCQEERQNFFEKEETRFDVGIYDKQRQMGKTMMQTLGRRKTITILLGGREYADTTTTEYAGDKKCW